MLERRAADFLIWIYRRFPPKLRPLRADQRYPVVFAVVPKLLTLQSCEEWKSKLERSSILRGQILGFPHGSHPISKISMDDWEWMRARNSLDLWSLITLVVLTVRSYLMCGPSPTAWNWRSPWPIFGPHRNGPGIFFLDIFVKRERDRIYIIPHPRAKILKDRKRFRVNLSVTKIRPIGPDPKSEWPIYEWKWLGAAFHISRPILSWPLARIGWAKIRAKMGPG
jgi:hypothetical protein